MATRVGKNKKSRSKMSAAHKKAISEGLKAYHARGGRTKPKNRPAASRYTDAQLDQGFGTGNKRRALWEEQLLDKERMDKAVLGKSGKGAIKEALKFAGRSARRMLKARLTGSQWGPSK